MVFDLCALLMTATMTVIIGGPLAARLARITIFPNPIQVDPQGQRQIQRTTVFQPLDFGPDLMIWPSEHQRPDAGRPQPQWPSAKWDDPHFGKGASATARQQFDAADNARQEGRPPTKRSEAAPPLVQPAAKPKQAAQAAPPATAPKEKAKPKPKPPPPAAKQQAPAQQAQKPQPPAKTAPAPAATTTSAPSTAPTAPSAETADAIERLVSERGLAGAVQFLMQQNGWDFRTAASFLASHRKR